MKYDIRTKESAKKFIKDFLEIDDKELKSILEKYENDVEFFETNYIDKIKSKEINELEIYGYHFTTNPDNCKAIKFEGIKNLQEVLKSENEFTNLLKKYQIRFDIENSKMYYKNEKIDISFDNICSNDRTSSISVKIYYDYAINGFLCNGERYADENEIFKNPEFLGNISDFIGNNEIKEEWKSMCETYSIIFKTDISHINCIESFGGEKPNKIKISMLCKAIEKILYDNTVGKNFIIFKDDKNIESDSIIKIEKLIRK
ncbi:MAG TPA: hypothetical protein OIM49_07405 [Clostridiaceae bacterium]|nr:hypothetical protein [Clostridiaceae bacterium]